MRPYFVLLWAALTTGCGDDGGFAGEVPACGSDGEARACDVFDLVNEERQASGLTPYTWNRELAIAAQAHAEDMVAQGYFSHDSLDGRTFVDRADDAGYDAFPSGENIAAGQTTPEQVMASWLGSSGHRMNILSNGHSEIGVGVDTNTWVQVFGTRQ